jgi:hypothetical protein
MTHLRVPPIALLQYWKRDYIPRGRLPGPEDRHSLITLVEEVGSDEFFNALL